MSNMSTIYLLRHGESELNLIRDEIVGGRSNHTPLTPRGHKQAALAGKWLLARHIVPEVVMCSPAVRARMTVQDALRTLGSDKEVTIDDRIQELGQGIMEGRSRQEVWTDEASAAVLADPMNFAHPEGETFHDVQDRMLDWYYDAVHNHPGAIVLAGGHGLSIRALAGALLGWSHAEIMAATTPNCSLTRIDDNNGHPSVAYVGKQTSEQ